MLEYFIKNPWHAAGLLLIIAINAWFFNFVRTPAYAVYVDGRLQYIVRDRQDFDRMVKEVVAAKELQTGKKVTVANDIAYTVDLASEDELLPDAALKDDIVNSLDYQISAAAICVNEKPVVYVESQAAAQALLEELKAVPFECPPDEKIISTGFMEKVDIRDARVNERDVKSNSEAREIIQAGSDEPQKHVVQVGDTVSLIASENGISQDALLKANNMQPGDYVSVGQELLIIKDAPYINVVWRTAGDAVEPIPYGVTEEIDPSSSNLVQIIQEGQDGERWVSYIRSYVNGVDAGRLVIQEKVNREPVKRVVRRSEDVKIAGRMGAGCLYWPCDGIITQYYKGDEHHGIDIGVQEGTPIYASAAGKVVFAGEQSCYGEFIIIDHGNGLITRYAHNSRIEVNVGDWVDAGQEISLSGNTGYSTGPHLHFEVIANGTVVDPLYYLN